MTARGGTIVPSSGADGDARLIGAAVVGVRRAANSEPAGPGRAVVIAGPSGAGKSTLALEMIARGAVLIGDDGAALRRSGDALIVSAPAATCGLIEARGLGVLRLPVLDAAILALWIELQAPGRIPDAPRDEIRLPRVQSTALLGASLPLIVTNRSSGLAAALVCLLRDGALMEPDPPPG